MIRTIRDAISRWLHTDGTPHWSKRSSDGIDSRDLIEGSLRADPERVSKRYTRHYYDLKVRLSDEEWQQFVSLAADEYDVDAEDAARRGKAHREELGIASPRTSNPN